MKLVCVATHSERYFPILQQSAKIHGWDLVVLGFGQKWKGFGMKFRLVRKYIEDLPDDEIICHVDAFDTVVLASQNEVLRKYEEADTDILVSVDDLTRLDPIMKYLNSRVFSAKDNYPLNSGCYIGRVGSLKKMFNSLCSSIECSDAMDDQIALSSVISEKEKDVESKIFLNLLDTIIPIDKTFIVQDGRLVYGKSIPCFVSAPGAGNMDWLKELGYKIPISSSGSLNTKIKKVTIYIKYFVPEMVLLFLIFFALPKKCALLGGILLILYILYICYG